MNVPCAKCGVLIDERASFKVIHLEEEWHLCGRICLVEWMAPEIQRAIVVRQWVPTDDEVAKMSE